MSLNVKKNWDILICIVTASFIGNIHIIPIIIAYFLLYLLLFLLFLFSRIEAVIDVI